MPTSKSPTNTNHDELTRAAYVAFQLDSIVKALSENAERQTKWEGKIEQQLNGFHVKLDQIPEKYVSKEELKEKLEPLNRDLTSINQTLSRLNWIVITAVIMALIGFVITNPLGGS